MKKKIFRLLSIVLCIIYILSSANFVVFAQNFLKVIESVSESNNTNPFSKINFYCNVEENYEIDSHHELIEATNKLRAEGVAMASTSSTTQQGGLPINITVQFAGDFTKTQEYADYLNERSKIKTSEESRSFRKKLTSTSKAFHDTIYEDNVESLEILDYDA